MTKAIKALFSIPCNIVRELREEARVRHIMKMATGRYEGLGPLLVEMDK